MAIMKWRQPQGNLMKELMDIDHPFLGFSLAPVFEQNFRNLFPALKDGGWSMAVDVSEDKENITVKADLPGLKKEEIDITLDDTVLTIKGQRKAEDEKKDKNYHRVERSYGAFERSFDLGIRVDEAKIKATYKDGVLEIVLPKKEQARSKQIEIKTE